MPTPPRHDPAGHPARATRLTPALILAAGAVTAVAILGAAVRDSTPPQLPRQTVDVPTRTPNDPAQSVP